MECAPGDIFYSDFPSSDACEFKDRPVLIVAKIFGNDIIVCMVTHKKSSFDVCIEVSNADLEDGRLETNPSFIRPVRLFTANPKIFRRKAGRVKQHILTSVLNELAKKFSSAA
jgi:mRNA interferase MazF